MHEYISQDIMIYIENLFLNQWSSNRAMFAIRRVAILSTHDLSFLKSACSSHRRMLSRMILQSILLGIDSGVIPLQLLHWDLSPLFGILLSNPLHQSSGICSSCQILFRELCMQVIDTSSNALTECCQYRQPCQPVLNGFQNLCLCDLAGSDIQWWASL